LNINCYQKMQAHLNQLTFNSRNCDISEMLKECDTILERIFQPIRQKYDSLVQAGNGRVIKIRDTIHKTQQANAMLRKKLQLQETENSEIMTAVEKDRARRMDMIRVLENAEQEMNTDCEKHEEQLKSRQQGIEELSSLQQDQIKEQNILMQEVALTNAIFGVKWAESSEDIAGYMYSNEKQKAKEFCLNSKDDNHVKELWDTKESFMKQIY